jgi:hypothetical protein
MTMPNFLVIGAAKCGTDSLCNYLGQHPDIYISSNREPNFFVAEGQSDVPYCGPGDRAVLESLGMWVSTLDRYQSLFSEVTTEKAIGEGTAWYIYYDEAPARIQRHIPQAKLIAILRNPVDRAYSAYTMLLRDGRETIGDFARALAAEEDRTRRNWEPIWHYVKMGFYTSQLKRYYDTFEPHQIRVIVYDDFNTQPMEIVKDVFHYLDVDDQFSPDISKRYNVSLVPKNLGVHTLVAGEHPVKTAMKAVLPTGIRQALKQRVVERNLTRPAPMAPEVRRQLVEIFRADILELEKLIGRDLSHWLQ